MLRSRGPAPVFFSIFFTTFFFIVLSLLFGLVFFPLASKSYASMAKMKALQPEMLALRERRMKVCQADFVKAKQLQLASNILSSAAAGVVLANVAALFAGDASLAVLGETVQAAVPLIVITAIASVGAGAVGAARQ